MEREQRDRHAVGRQQLEMFNVREPIRTETKRQCGDDRRVVTPGEHECQPVRGDRAQRERQQQRDVVGGNRRGAEPDDRRRDQALAEAMIRECHRAGCRREKKAVPPPGSQRRGVGVPPQKRGAEQWIAEVMWHLRRKMRRNRMQQNQSQAQIPAKRDRKSSRGSDAV